MLKLLNSTVDIETLAVSLNSALFSTQLSLIKNYFNKTQLFKTLTFFTKTQHKTQLFH